MKTYGEINFDGQHKEWVITCEPHVSLRLKRVFSKIWKGSQGAHKLSATPENARDLLWFTERYPLSINKLDWQVLIMDSHRHRETEDFVFQLAEGRAELLPFKLALDPREYQRVAATMHLRKGNLLLADDVGLGKTASAICTFTDPRTLPAVVVTLTHLPRQWQEEIKRFAPWLTTHIIKKGTPYHIKQPPDVFIVNYHKLYGWAETLGSVAKSIVFDECQELRHRGSGKYRAAEHLANHMNFRMGLSATPIYNYGAEFFAVLNVLAPGSLGDHEEFLREWCEGGFAMKPRIKEPKAFGAYLRDTGLMLRRTRADVARELPALSKFHQFCESDEEALNEVSASCAELARLILRQGESERGEKWRASEEFNNRLRQATGIAKAPYVAAFVRMLVESGEKVVLYGWHREVYSIWLDKLKDLKPVMFTGSESPKQKEDSREAFVKGEAQVLVMSLRSGAGLDGLQYATKTVVFGELDWSPGVHEQCLDAETEILTLRGFVGIDQLNDADLVAGFDTSTERMQWLPILSRVDRALSDGEQMFALQTQSLDIRVTGGHRMVYRERFGRGKSKLSKWKIATAEELSHKTQAYEIPVAGSDEAFGSALTDDEIRFVAWFITDGNMNNQSRQVTISQAEASPYNDAIRSCLEGCRFKYGINRMKDTSQYQRNSTLLRYYVSRTGPKDKSDGRRGWGDLEPFLDKNMSPLLEALDERQLAIFLETLHMADGHKQTGQSWTQRSYHIGKANLTFIERLQSLCVRRGWRANIAPRVLPSGKAYAVIHIRKGGSRNIGGTSQHDRSSLAAGNAIQGERVWCVENELGTLVIRRNGKVAIVGNCIGRVYRDGQPCPVMAYFLVSDEGADPIIAQVLGIKRHQIEGVRQVEDNLVEQLTVDDNHIRTLAERYLAMLKR